MSFKNELLKGVAWIGIAKYSGLVISLITMSILARMISPADFGTYAIALVIMLFLNIFSDLGIGAAVIQYKELTQKDIESLFSFTVFLGFIFSAILYFAAWPISSFYENPDLIPICQLLCICLLFRSFSVILNGLMRRDKMFKEIALRTLAFQILGGSVSIIWAYNDGGLYSLLVHPIITDTGVFLVNYYYFRLRLRRIDLSSIKTVYNFSCFHFLTSIVNFFTTSTDSMIIGKVFPAQELGFYEKSTRLVSYPVNNVSTVVQPVLQPLLSDLNCNATSLKEKCNKIINTIANISFPIALVFYFCASEIITILFGSNWEKSVPVLEIMAFYIPFQMLTGTIPVFYQAAKNMKMQFFNCILVTVLTFICFGVAVLIADTIKDFATALCIKAVLEYIATTFIIYKYIFKTNPFSHIKLLYKQTTNCILVLFLCNKIFAILSVNNIFLSLILKCIVLATLSIVIALILKQYRFNTKKNIEVI